MSDLILMMWLVDVVSASKAMAVLAGIIMFVLCGWAFVAWGEGGDDVSAPKKWMWSIPIILMLTAWLMPTKQTLYAAIALKVGHEIAESRLGTKAITALEGILDEVIEKQGSKK